MAATVRERLEHILDATANIRALLAEKSIDSLRTEPVTRAALERFIEVISEASRYIPPDLKAKHPEISWVDIANIGNRLRHGYDMVDERILWDIYAFDIDASTKLSRACKTKPESMNKEVPLRKNPKDDLQGICAQDDKSPHRSGSPASRIQVRSPKAT